MRFCYLRTEYREHVKIFLELQSKQVKRSRR